MNTANVITRNSRKVNKTRRGNKGASKRAIAFLMSHVDPEEFESIVARVNNKR